MADEATNFSTFIWGAIVTIVGTLASAVFALWKLAEQKNAAEITKLDTQIKELRVESKANAEAHLKCEQDRREENEKLHSTIIALNQRINDIDKDGTRYSHRLDKREES